MANVAKKKYGGKVAKMEAGGKVSQDNIGATYRALSDAEIAERKKRAKLKAKLKNEANMRAQHRRDKQFLEDFKNADENDDMIRGNLIGKHADDTRSISQYGTDAQAGRSFGQKTRGKQSDMITKKAKGGAVRKYKGGGMVEGYEYGGEVSGNSRGGGAALRGTKFSGCK